MSNLEREAVRPGFEGYSSNPKSPPGEAYVFQNLLPYDLDGVARVRPGIATQYTYGADIDYLALHPSTEQLILTENGNLRYVNPASPGAGTVKDTGWPTKPIKSCTGIVSGERWWIAPKAAIGENPGGTIKRIDHNGNYDTLSADAPAANFVESYGVQTFATDEVSIGWAKSGDSSDWSALDSVAPPHKLGELFGFLALSDNQALLLGRDGMGIWTGSDEEFFAQQFTTNQRVVTPMYTACDCAGRVFLFSPGPSLRAYQSAMSPVHLPILRDLRAITDSQALRGWYDPVSNCYCFSNEGVSKVFLFDLDRDRWVGYWDKPLRGIAVQHKFSQPFMDRWFGWGPKLVKFDQTIYTDNGAAFEVVVQTVPTDKGNPAALKQMESIFVNATKTGTVTLKVRDIPEDSWVDYSLGTVTGPGWVKNIPQVNYRERVIEWRATAQSGLYFKSLLVEERVVGEDI